MRPRRTKIDIWNVFYSTRGWRKVELQQARDALGPDIPRHLLDFRRARLREQGSFLYLELTKEGREWLERGLMYYLKRNPKRASEVEVMPISTA